MSRFLLDLQAAHQRTFKPAQDDSSFFSSVGAIEDGAQGVHSLVFAGLDVVGSLRASLTPRDHASKCVGEVTAGLDKDEIERVIKRIP